MMDEQTAKFQNDLINIVGKQNEALFKLLDKLDEFDRRLKALEDNELQKTSEDAGESLEETGEGEINKGDFIIVTGPRGCGKTTALIKHVCRINRENEKNVAIIICSNHAEACFISKQADEMGYKDMPFPITIDALIAYAHSDMKLFYKLGFVNDIDRVLQRIIMPLELRGFTYTLPTKKEEK